jgi:predicted O-methyltransferase YrrM
MKNIQVKYNRRILQTFNMEDIYARRAKELRKLLPEDNIVGVEIGVDQGFFSFNLLTMYPEIVKIYGIDPYQKSSNNKGKGFSEEEWNNYYIDTLNRMKHFGSRFELIRQMSKDAIYYIPDNMDFIYIDGDHSFDNVLEDIRLYEPKVRVGGILCGHDYPCSKYPEVEKAVDFYAGQFNRELYSTREIDVKVGMWWWIRR